MGYTNNIRKHLGNNLIRTTQRICAILLIFAMITTLFGNTPFLNLFNVSANAMNLSDVQQRINSFRSVYQNGATGPVYYQYGQWMSEECWGFADTMFDYLFGTNTARNNDNKRYGNTALDTLCVGDHVRRTSPRDNFIDDGHSFIVTSIIGDNITYVDCNGDYPTIYNKVKWDRSITKQELLAHYKVLWVEHYPYSSVNVPLPGVPSLSVPSLTKSTENVKFSWLPTSNTKYYDLRILKNGNIINPPYTSVYGTSYSYKLPVGSYTAYLCSVNDDYTNWWTSGNTVSFSVYNATPPMSPTSVQVSAENIGIGDSITASWANVSGATDYIVNLICPANTKYNQTKSVTTNNSSFILNEPGTYNVSIVSKNSAGSSGSTISKDFIVNPNCNVIFKDFDEKVLRSQNIKYGGSVVAPIAPSREGYTFQGWSRSLTNITSDTTIKANYLINTYSVKFLDKDSNIIGSVQRIDYGQKAVPPSNVNTPINYKFAGWNSSDYEFVKSNLTIQAVYVWENVNIPIIASIISASRNTLASGYNIQVKLDNYPNSLTKAKLVTSLKTEGGKMVASETETFNLVASGTSTKDVFISYSGVATKVEVSVVGVVDDDSTGTPKSSTVSKDIDLGLDWSDWSVNLPPAGDYVTETRNEYRYQDKQTTTSTSNVLSGWTQYDVTPSWGAWSGWSATPVTAGATREVNTRQVANPQQYKTQWYYGRYWCGGDYYTFANPHYEYADCHFEGSEWRDYEFIYYSDLGEGSYWYIDPYDSSYLKNWYRSPTINNGVYTRSVALPLTYHKEYQYRDLVNTYSFYKWGNWSSWSTISATASVNKNVETRITNRFKSKGIKLQCFNYKRYKYQNLNNGNFYYSYSPTYADSMNYPGEWQYNKLYSELNVVSVIEDNISLYKGYGENSWYKADVNTFGTSKDYVTYETLEDTSGVVRTITGKLNAPGKKATLMIYKGLNSDPTASQLEYVAQTTLGVNGEYSFTFSTKEEPSLVSGDFILMIGLEGATSPIYISTILAPLPTYIVTFVDENGSVLDKQTVIKGNSAVSPVNPSKVGYDFVGWDTGTTNVREDLTIKAKYIKKKCVVVFVNWDSSDIEITSFNYGDELKSSVVPQKFGSIFEAWVLANGQEVTMVTDNMIVEAKYILESYKVTFLDWTGKVINEQTILFGDSAELPAPLAAPDTKRQFLVWSNYENALNVDKDIVLYPVARYNNDASIPIASLESGEYIGSKTLTLTASDNETKIYYTVNDKAPCRDYSTGGFFGNIYSKPIQIDETSLIQYIAIKDGYNDSALDSRVLSIQNVSPTSGPTLSPNPTATATPNPNTTPTPTPTLTPTLTPTPTPTPTPIKVTGIFLSQTSASLIVGKTLQIFSSILPTNATNQSIVWISSNDKIASVSDSGVISAKAPGTVNISAITVEGAKKATCKVTVIQPVTSVKLNKTTLSLNKGKTSKLISIINPSNASNKKVTWKSSNTKIATVSSTGTVKGIKKGSCYITVVTVDGKKSAKCKVVVK